MAESSDYETLLRSMSALSQQFAQQRSRTAGTSPNPTLTDKRARSRVAKPKSTNASPRNAGAFRRRAATAQQRSAVAQHSAMFIPAAQAEATVDGPRDFFIGTSSDFDRPRSWHADMQPPASWMPASQPFPAPMSDTYPQMPMDVPDFIPSNLGQDLVYPFMSNPMWFTAQSNPIGACSASDLTSQLERPVDSMEIATFSNNAAHFASRGVTSSSNPMLDVEQYQSPAHYADRLISDEAVQPEGEGELIGMGLYDRTATDEQQTSQLLDAGLQDEVAPKSGGKGLQLEETWAPSAEQVPEAEPDDDEGSDTPVTIDFHSWAPIDGNDFDRARQATTTEASFVYTTPDADVEAQLPHVMGAEFYDYDSSMIHGEILDAQPKMSNTMNWYNNQWLYYPRQGYYDHCI